MYICGMQTEEFLKQVSNEEKHRIASMPFHGDLELVIDAMEKYAKLKTINKTTMKNKLTITIIAFLLLIPFRLPISILFIHFFSWVIGATSNEVIPKDILATNIIVTKIVYNIAISILFLVNLELFSRQKMGRNARTKNYKCEFNDEPIYWYIVPIALLLIAFIIMDSISVYNIFFIK